MYRTVTVNSEVSRYAQNISVGLHTLHADEQSDIGGNDAGPNPYELLLSALGACASITVRMYAERKQWPLRSVQVRLSNSKVRAEGCAECDRKDGMVDRIVMGISFAGELSEEQKSRLLEIANKCPVHRTLVSKVQIEASLVDAECLHEHERPSLTPVPAPIQGLPEAFLGKQAGR